MMPVLIERPDDLDLVEHHAGREAYYRGLLEKVKRKIEQHRGAKEAALERLKHPSMLPPNAPEILKKLEAAAQHWKR